VRFIADDEFGLWGMDDEAEDLGNDMPPGSTPIHSFRMLTGKITGQIVTLTRPYDRGIVERISNGD
jgi:hypothetical protein